MLVTPSLEDGFTLTKMQDGIMTHIIKDYGKLKLT
jgi:hypothetical protein